ncbi:STELLO glycosyltransferase family protein [Azospirillum sp.]|uniref:STELLO glycosyltransferase family protein n=1 Tax=Azospirillum sp. TaxID=34012 RepID=UPI002610F587|nr:STELLO glycosyltransferase family protein [Azospirillum sp.]
MQPSANASTAVVITTINSPTPGLEAIAAWTRNSGFPLIVVGDRKSPEKFSLEGADFWSLARQLDSGYAFARACPVGHYARKCLGYLVAMRAGAKVIIETDDDNLPREGFFTERRLNATVPVAHDAGWVNVYAWYTDDDCWPRGLPLDRVRQAPPPFESLESRSVPCPIQQGLADEDPDVDAIFRLTRPLPVHFRKDRTVALTGSSWCPFNSQNTTWFSDAFPLMYLPATCSFRMTDIWRSFIAQRIAAANGWGLLFHGPTVWQERNAHDLLRDFREEISGYLNNGTIMEKLAEAKLPPGPEHMAENLRVCYRILLEMRLVEAVELELLDAWLSDIAAIK